MRVLRSCLHALRRSRARLREQTLTSPLLRTRLKPLQRRSRLSSSASCVRGTDRRRLKAAEWRAESRGAARRRGWRGVVAGEAAGGRIKKERLRYKPSSRKPSKKRLQKRRLNSCHVEPSCSFTTPLLLLNVAPLSRAIRAYAYQCRP